MCVSYCTVELDNSITYIHENAFLAGCLSPAQPYSKLVLLISFEHVPVAGVV